MAPKDHHQATGALELSLPWFRSVAGLWLAALAVLGYASLDPSYAGPERWVMDGLMHVAIFLPLALFPALLVRSMRYLAVTVFFTLGLAVGLEAAQAALNRHHLEYGDMVANLLGVALAMTLAIIVRRRVRGFRRSA